MAEPYCRRRRDREFFWRSRVRIGNRPPPLVPDPPRGTGICPRHHRGPERWCIQFCQLFSGYFADKLGRRRDFALGGSVATAVFPAIIAVAGSWYLVLAGRLVGWIGKGIRSPSRDAILSKSVEKKDLGKAFGFHRTGDTLGAIAGPVVALILVSSMGIREILWLAVIPGFLAFAALWLFLSERDASPHPRPRPIVASLKGLPSQFRSFLSAVLVFGIADFSQTLLIAFAIVSLTPSLGFTAATATGAGLYVIRNIAYAGASYPLGLLGDRIGRRPVLVFGYALAVANFIGFVIAPVNVVAYGILFALCGIFIAAEDTLESALAGEMVDVEARALGFGALATVNGVGDLVSSVMIGFIWTLVGYSAGVHCRCRHCRCGNAPPHLDNPESARPRGGHGVRIETDLRYLNGQGSGL